jgi:hypothetical protein
MSQLYRKRIEIELSDCKEIIGGTHGLGSYNIATTYGSCPFIVLDTIPKSEYSKIERNMEEIIEHEVIHITISSIEDNATSKALDNLFPLIGDLERYKDIEFTKTPEPRD